MSEKSPFTRQDRGFLDGLAKKSCSFQYIRHKEYRNGYEIGCGKYRMRLR